ncbi:MAG TPA: SRPBCC family protein [Streptosporangiaceae bacterium]|jgi:hypothetical protein
MTAASPAGPDDVTGMRVGAEIVVTAAPGVVWDLLADITNVGNWSPECIHTGWLDGEHDARPGVRFSGRNRAQGGFEWTVTCVITEASRPWTLAWVVLDDEDRTQTVDDPSSHWRYGLEPAPGGATLVRHSFVHGPGDSGLRWMIRRYPERAAGIIADRRLMLLANMRHGLSAMKAVAEGQHA